MTPIDRIGERRDNRLAIKNPIDNLSIIIPRLNAIATLGRIQEYIHLKPRTLIMLIPAILSFLALACQNPTPVPLQPLSPIVTPTPTPSIINNASSQLLHDIICMQNPIINPWMHEAEKWSDYQGPLYIYIPDESEIGPTEWSTEEKRRLNGAVEKSLKVIREVFGQAPAWTKDQVVIIVDDFLGLTTEQQNLAAYFVDGDIIAPAIGKFCSQSLIDALSKTNLTVYPKHKLNEKPDYQVAYEMANELTHAYTQYPDSFPKIWDEGIARMITLLIHEKESETDPAAKADYDIVTNYITIPYEKFQSQFRELGINVPDKKVWENMSYKEIKDQYPLVSDYINYFAGMRFKEWYESHPDFFITLRIKENIFFQQYGRPPNKEEWLDLAGPEFKDWVAGEPILQIEN